MHRPAIALPSLVRIKPGAVDRLGVYLARAQQRRVAVLVSEGLPAELQRRLESALAAERIEAVRQAELDEASFERVAEIFAAWPADYQAVIGFGGGKALDAAKYLAFLADRPYYAVPTSLSNDGFCSPQSSLTLGGRRRSLAARLPQGVVIDAEICLGAPEALWLSGVGDLVAKVTAVRDWKLAFHARGEPVDDLAALLSDATVFQFLARPVRDRDGMQLLGTALMLNGIAMEICGSSRPASGGEHLISHALDRLTSRPRLHGLQVGVAAYLTSRLQEQGTERIAKVFDRTGFWKAVSADPFSLEEWRRAIAMAPEIKPGFYTVLSVPENLERAQRLLTDDPRLAPCFA